MAFVDGALQARLESLLDKVGHFDQGRAARLVDALTRRPELVARRARAAAKRTVEDHQLQELVAEAETLVGLAVEHLDGGLTPRQLATLRLAALDAALEEVAGAPDEAGALGAPLTWACG